MQIGDVVSIKKTALNPDDLSSGKMLCKARVIYIHPKHRFYTVQFDNGIRESYHFVRRVGDARGKGMSCRRSAKDGNCSRKY